MLGHDPCCSSVPCSLDLGFLGVGFETGFHLLRLDWLTPLVLLSWWKPVLNTSLPWNGAMYQREERGLGSDTESPLTLSCLLCLEEVFWTKSQEISFLTPKFYLFLVSLDTSVNPLKWKYYDRIIAFKIGIIRGYVIKNSRCRNLGAIPKTFPSRWKCLWALLKLDGFNILDFQDTQSILSLTDFQDK